MTNLEKMKRSIIEQIKEMNEQQFEQFIFQLQDIAISPLDISDIKFCDICKSSMAAARKIPVFLSAERDL